MRIEKMTQSTQTLLREAQSIAVSRDHQTLEPIHILRAMLKRDSVSGIKPVLLSAGANIRTLDLELERALTKMRTSAGHADLSIGKETERLFHIAETLAQEIKDAFISTDIVLMAMIESKSLVTQLLETSGIDLNITKEIINSARDGQHVDTADWENAALVLEKYTVDLTSQAEAGKLDPVIGRDDEIRRAIQVLQRRTKNNPVLIGEPGVGKTAIIEGLAQRVVNGEVPEGIKGKRILALDLGALLAGTKFRGDFEERLKKLLIALNRQANKIVLFIDELHTLVGAGRVEGSMDAGNMLKPALARGELHCVGATTINEYRQHLESDAALERRFQKVLISQPNEEDTVAILRGLKERYEVHHSVHITDSAIIAATKLSQRYITDRQLPDKAIDLIDEAASRIRMEIDSKPESLDRLERRLVQLKIEREAVKKDDTPSADRELNQLNVQIDSLDQDYAALEQIWLGEKSAVDIVAQIKSAIEHTKLELEVSRRAGDLTRMSEIQHGILPELERQLLLEAEEDRPEPTLLRSKVTEEEIAEIVSRWTGIPVNRVLQGDQTKLLMMEETLKASVIGQEEAISSVTDAVKRSRAGLSDPERPNGSFLFLGPTGVGKTELCKALAKCLFDSEAAMIRIDMSEFMEQHSVARLIGAPPGYVGYDAGGYLTERVRRSPYSLVLLDEVEKAHRDVLNILLQVLDDGRLTDGRGRMIDFRNTVIVMTSNLGSEHSQHLNEANAAERSRASIMRSVRQYFHPEFINRIDDCIIFHALDINHIRKIAALRLEDLSDRLEQRDVKLKATSSVVEYIASSGFDPAYGARPLNRLIQRLIENPLAQGIIEGQYEPGDIIEADLIKGDIGFRKVESSIQIA